MVGLGAAMRSRGHRVQVIVNPYFQTIVEQADLELLALGSADQYRELMQHPDLWHPRRGPKLVMTRGAAAYLREAHRLVAANYRAGETVLAAHGLDLGSRVFQETQGAPLATVHFAPFALHTFYDTPRYIGLGSMKFWPRRLKAAFFGAVHQWMVDPWIAPEVNALRGEHGLPPVRRLFAGWNNSPQLVLGLFPEWFAAAQPDWPANTHTVGFPLWDPPAQHELASDVDRFLAAGEAPLAFAPGSANVQAGDFFRAAAEACRRLGRRGMLMTKYPEQLPRTLPDGVQHFGFVPFSMLLPRVAALVHHGGIGTCAQGLAAGLPQVVMPMAYDQLDNGLRLVRLGTGAVVPRNRFTPGRVAGALAGLLDSPATAAACARWAGKCDGPSSLAAACDLLEDLHLRTNGRNAAAPEVPRGALR
jgi:rhamnosyltransferase subunit B